MEPKLAWTLNTERYVVTAYEEPGGCIEFQFFDKVRHENVEPLLTRQEHQHLEDRLVQVAFLASELDEVLDHQATIQPDPQPEPDHEQPDHER